MTLDENGVAFGKVVIVEHRLTCKLWKSTGNVHVFLRSLEGGTGEVGNKGLRDTGRGVPLVDECETNRLLEGVAKKAVVFGAHENEEHRHMCAFTDSVSVEVCTDAHAVAVRTGVERRGVEADCATV